MGTGLLKLLTSLILFSLAAPVYAGSQPELEIDRIDLTGVRAFSSQLIETTLEISPGDRLERLKVVQTEKNLQSLYRSHGYEEVSIRSRLIRKKNGDKGFETVLQFDVMEGKPVRLAEIEIVPSKTDRDNFKRLWERKLPKLRASIPVEVGGVFDQEKIAEGRRAIQEILASEEFIGGKVDQVKVTNSSAPNVNANIKPVKKIDDIGNVSRWVSVEFKVDLGEKVTFGFRGNTVFTLGHMNSIVEEQRLLGLGKDYINVLRVRIEEEYRSAGYARVEVIPYTFEDSKSKERRVTFVIQEGPKLKIDEINFDGNTVFSSADLRDQFLSKASGLVQHGTYVEKDIQKAAELVIEMMREKGYLSAKLVTINMVPVLRPRSYKGDASVRLLIYLYEGDQTAVQSIKVTGIQVFSREQILKLLGFRENDPLNLYAFTEGIEAIKRAYRSKGYLDFRILNEGTNDLISYSQENQFADVVLDIEEGPQYKVSRIEVEGLEKTKEFVVRRELKFKVGEVLEEPQIEQSERQLRRLGIFGGVGIRVVDDPAQPGYKMIRVSASETDRGSLAWGPGFRNDLGVRAFGQLSYVNLWGENHAISMNTSVNRRFYKYNFVEAQGQVAYTWPWFLIPGVTFRPALSIGRTQYINFSADNATISASWDKQLLASPTLIGNLTYTFERINQYQAVNANDNRQMTIGTITPRLSLDLRDNSLAPRSGFFSTAWLDVASPSLLSQAEPFPIGYYRVQFRGDYYVPVSKDITWSVSFRTGYEQSTVHTIDPNNPSADPTQDAIPLIKQFAMGGIGSLRGYAEQELNYQLSNIRGSLSYVNYRTQLDLPFAGALKFALFFDAANLLQDRYSFGDLRYGAGFGFHYLTPVGPVSLDWGFKISPPPGVDAYVVHFSVGVI